MKKITQIKPSLLSLISLAILSMFLFMAETSEIFTPGGMFYEASTVAESYILEDGRRNSTFVTNGTIEKSITGSQDPQGRWHGPVIIDYGQYRGDPNTSQAIHRSTEEVTMRDGLRHGRGVTNYVDGKQEIHCWNMGKRVECDDARKKGAALFESGYDVLSYEYPWFLTWMDAFGFEHSFVEAYTDTLELLIYQNDLSQGDFEDFYQVAIDSLLGTRFDSVVNVHNKLFILIGYEEMKQAMFRLAVIDQSRREGSGSLFGMIQEKYPGYMTFVDSMAIPTADFQAFCNAFDSTMMTYTPLTLDDPFYVDSIENRMYLTLSTLANDEEEIDTTTALKGLKLNMNLEQHMESIPQSEIAGNVFLSILIHLMHGDKILESLKQAYHVAESIATIPTVTTAFISNTSATSAEIQGVIHSDGGSTVTASGIVWASHYNPTLEDNVENVSATHGIFTVELKGLTEGETYFACSYATNEEGTSFGNNVEFKAQSTVGVQSDSRASRAINLYPNPASDQIKIQLEFMVETELDVIVYNASGQRVMENGSIRHDPGSVEIMVDISHLEAGFYTCQVIHNNTHRESLGFVIER